MQRTLVHRQRGASLRRSTKGHLMQRTLVWRRMGASLRSGSTLRRALLAELRLRPGSWAACRCRRRSLSTFWHSHCSRPLSTLPSSSLSYACASQRVPWLGDFAKRQPFNSQD